ncbi:MAG TPA: hypothetical protein VKX46_04910 [Ktedonobacteraceae bacterium]|nr:hypothetical protein [Ktedonobacteraceae bacterium]
MYHPDIHSQAGTLNSSRQSPPRRGGFRRRLNLLAAIVLLVVLVGSLTIVFAALRNRPGGSASPATGVPLSVTSVSMSVTPGSIAGLACGTNVTVTYTALFHVRPNSVGGTVRFTYTTNNGRGSTPASITFNPGETSKSYSFTCSGALPTDHTAPGPGGVQVTSPNQLTSQMVAPAGQCTAGAFQVTSVTMAVNPSSIQGMACGTSITVTYIATLHVAANSPGGTVQFTYTTNNGRNSTPASLTFNPGQTSRTFSFTWSGALPADHTYPGLGGIQITSPNQLTSQMVAPSGQCSTPSAAFQVTGVTMSVSPASIQGMACGTSVTVTYTATIHVTANSPGGTVQFTYTTNNGRSSTPASITFSPGQTSRTYSFTWSGALPADHTYPGLGGIQVTAPNQLTSQMVKPGGQCS